MNHNVRGQPIAADTREHHADEDIGVRYLHPGTFSLWMSNGGCLGLALDDGRSFPFIQPKRCFPLTFPTKYLSLTDDKGTEIGIIQDLDDLCDEYKVLVEAELELRYYTLRINSINLVKERFGGTDWQVQTNRGFRKFVTKDLQDITTEIVPGRYMVLDTDGNRYELAVDRLDRSSQAKIMKLL